MILKFYILHTFFGLYDRNFKLTGKLTALIKKKKTTTNKTTSGNSLLKQQTDGNVFTQVTSGSEGNEYNI